MKIENIEACVFDAYGTLFDVNSAAAKCKERLGSKWESFANAWRTTQLEYTWLRSLMKKHKNFWEITEDSLDHTMETFKIKKNMRSELLNLLQSIKSEGKTIAGFGAPAKATTLMYQFGIDNKYIDFIIDDSPLKQGLYTPGLKIPVMSSDAIKLKKPDYLIILAWNFSESIVKKNNNFIEQGGKFIVPLPNLSIIGK